ncbi:hypothetical protein AURDEDRAFT_182036 [Auricularia subglabra TFB-10046 SS5]|nr:hypothetical protein AURDEDRAFT_182036 [Auricularia subglabra TFB-10046 SS5]
MSAHDTPGLLLFAQLPQELILHIFELGARLDQNWALELCRLSRQVAHCVRPVIYETIVLSSVTKTDSFLYTLRVGDKAFFARHIKNILVADGVLELMYGVTSAAINAIWAMAQACPGLQRLVVPVMWVARLVRMAAEKGETPCPALRHVVLTRTRNLHVQPDFSAPLFRSLTRLFIQSHYYVWLPQAMLVRSDTFPALTHLAVLHMQFQDSENAQDSDGMLTKRLPSALELPVLRRLMICCQGLEAPEGFARELARFEDPRIRVVMGFTTTNEVLPEFKLGDEWWEAGIEVYPAG